MSAFDEPPDGDPHGECAAEIARLTAELNRRKGDPSTRLHNLCEAIAEEADGSEFSREEWERIDAENAALRGRVAKLEALINAPEMENFLRGVHIEAVHQVERWGTAHDRAKRPADWFWLVGYLGGKALHALLEGKRDKGLHHCISTAAALYNWHCAIKGVDVSMCPGRSDLAEMVDGVFPGEAQT